MEHVKFLQLDFYFSLINDNLVIILSETRDDLRGPENKL